MPPNGLLLPKNCKEEVILDMQVVCNMSKNVLVHAGNTRQEHEHEHACAGTVTCTMSVIVSLGSR